MKHLLISLGITAVLFVPLVSFAISVPWERPVLDAIHPLFPNDQVVIGGTSTTTNSELFVNGAITTTGLLDIDGTGTSTTAGNLDVTGDIAATNFYGDMFVGSLEFKDTSLTQGSVLFVGADGEFTEDNTNFFWDDTNNRLGIGDTSPASLFTVGSGDLFQVNSSGAIAAATGITSSGSITFSGLSDGIIQSVSGVLSASSTIAASNIEDAFLRNNGDTATGDYTFDTDTLVIDSSNNRVGVGTTTPAAKIQSLSTTEQLRLGFDESNYLATTISSNGDALFDFTSGTNAVATYKFDEKSSGAMINFDTNTRALAAGGMKVHYSHGGIVTGRTEFKINPSSYTLSLTPSLGSTSLNEIFTINGTDRKMTLSTGTVSPPTNYTGFVIDNRNLSANSTASLEFLSGSYSVTSAITHQLLTVSTSALYFSTEAGEGARLNGNNDFGVGTGSTVSARLHAISTAEQLRLGYDASNYWSNTINSTGGLTMQGVGTGGSLTIEPTAGQGMNIDLSTTGDFALNTDHVYVDTSSGNVGIGTSTPAFLLDVDGDARFGEAGNESGFLFDAGTQVTTMVKAIITETLQLFAGANPTVDTQGEIAYNTSFESLSFASSTSSGTTVEIPIYDIVRPVYASSTWTATSTRAGNVTTPNFNERITTGTCYADGSALIRVGDGTNFSNDVQLSSGTTTVTFTSNNFFNKGGERWLFEMGTPSTISEVQCSFELRLER